MSHAVFGAYLAAGGFTLVTTADEWDARKKDAKMAAVMEYVCPSGHTIAQALSTLKNKRSRHGSSYTGFCARCAREAAVDLATVGAATTPIAEAVAFGQSVDSEAVGDQVQAASASASTEETSVEEETNKDGDVAEEHVSEGEHVSDGDHPVEDTGESPCAHGPLPGDSAAARYAAAEPEFASYYAARWPLLVQNFRATGLAAMFDDAPYTGVVVEWLTTTKNPWTRSYFTSSDIRVGGSTVRVPALGLTVLTQTALVHNLDPAAACAAYSAHRPCIVVVCDGGAVVDAWYLIAGKKPFSAVHRHAFRMDARVVGGRVRDDAEYFYFEKHVFEREDLVTGRPVTRSVE